MRPVFVFLVLVLTASSLAQAQKSQHFTLTSRNLLTGSFDSVSVATALVSANDWKPYPELGDRTAWEAVPELVRMAHVAEAESLLGMSWPQLPATVFLEFDRIGNRTNYQTLRNVRRRALATLVLGEVFDNRGRFLDDIVNGVWAISEETYWGVPAHLDLQSSGFGLPDVDEPTVDLFAAETASLMAWTLYLLGDRLDEVSPLVGRRIRVELKRRILDPNLERDDFWWMALEPSVINNWTPWVNSNWLTTVLIAEDDPDRRSAAVDKIMRSVDVFLNSYPDDGGCDEGPGNWTRAGGALLEVLEFLKNGTSGLIDIYDEPLVREMGRYILRGYIGGDYFINFADARPKVTPPAAVIFRYGHRIGDSSMMEFASFLGTRQKLGTGYIQGQFGHLGRQLMTMFELDEMYAVDGVFSLPTDVWLPDTQIMTARSSKLADEGLFLAVKAGHNEENHNHNDVGSFIIYADGRPVIIDLGPATYTRQTFSEDRYSIWNLQSGYHNVATINGTTQSFGAEYRATDVAYASSPDSATISMDLTAAYPAGAAVTRWKRRITLFRGEGRSPEVSITDDYALSDWVEPTTLNLMTNRDATIEEPGRIRLEDPDSSASSVVYLTFDPDGLAARLELIQLDDFGLQRSWGDAVTRIILETRDGRLSDTIEMTFKFPGRDPD